MNVVLSMILLNGSVCSRFIDGKFVLVLVNVMVRLRLCSFCSSLYVFVGLLLMWFLVICRISVLLGNWWCVSVLCIVCISFWFSGIVVRLMVM